MDNSEEFENNYMMGLMCRMVNMMMILRSHYLTNQ